jgi:HK97 gp10 family phage protein
MALKFSFDSSQIDTFLADARKALEASLRPVAQAGAEVFYRAVLQNANFPVSKKMHWFYGTSWRKYGIKYGPFYPGNLAKSVYQAWSQKHSGVSKQTYEVSWSTKVTASHGYAPYGHMVEFGTSRTPARAFIGHAAGSQPMAVDAMQAKLDEQLTKAGIV